MLPNGRTTTEAKVARAAPMGDSIKLSNLEYPMIRPMSLVTQRRQIEHSAQSTSYQANSTITTYINSGDDYVWGKGCYFRFDITWATQDGDYNSQGSAVNVIDNISLYHSSGTLIDRVDGVNLRHAVWTQHTRDVDYFTRDAKNYGYSEANTAGTKYEYAVSLGDLHPFWNTDKLIPAMIHSGMKIVIQLAPNTIPNSGTAGGTYTLTDPVLVMDQLTLTDSAQLFLQEQSAKNGLVFPFKSWEHIDSSSASGTSYNMSVFRAVSQATEAFAVARETANIADGEDSFLPDAVNTTGAFSVQWKLASQYYPVKALSSQADLFHWNRNQISTDIGVRKSNLLPNATMNTGVHVVRLERDHLLKHQGVPVSGSRSLTYTASFGDAGARTIDVFMSFVKILRCFLFDRLIVSE